MNGKGNFSCYIVVIYETTQAMGCRGIAENALMYTVSLMGAGCISSYV